MPGGPSVRKFRACRTCAAYGRLYRERLLPDAVLALQSWHRKESGRPARYADQRLRTRGVRATIHWIHHVRTQGARHVAAVEDEILRALAERILHIVARRPRYGDTALAWCALKRLVGWNAPTGRYSDVVTRLLQDWRADDYGTWLSGPEAEALRRGLWNQQQTMRKQQAKPVLLGVVTTDAAGELYLGADPRTAALQIAAARNVSPATGTGPGRPHPPQRRCLGCGAEGDFGGAAVHCPGWSIVELVWPVPAAERRRR